MIIVDLEATGLDINNCCILSIGAIDFYNPENFFYQECRAWNNSKINETALKINGFGYDEIYNENKQNEKELINNFINWYDNFTNKTIAGQNPMALDVPLLEKAAKYLGYENKFGHKTIDLHTLGFFKFIQNGKDIPLKDNNISDIGLDDIANMVGLYEEPHPHNALNGAKFEAECFSRIIFGKKLLKDFQDLPIKNKLN